MNKILRELGEAAEGLLFVSESDYPLEVVVIGSGDIEREIRKLTGKVDAKIEKQTVDYFFRNMVKDYPGYSEVQKSLAIRFLKLQELLKAKLKDAAAYRIGVIQVDAYILGQMQDGSFGGLKTRLVET